VRVVYAGEPYHSGRSGERVRRGRGGKTVLLGEPALELPNGVLSAGAGDTTVHRSRSQFYAEFTFVRFSGYVCAQSSLPVHAWRSLRLRLLFLWQPHVAAICLARPSGVWVSRRRATTQPVAGARPLRAPAVRTARHSHGVPARCTHARTHARARARARTLHAC
jgi:hypothetical protein